MTSLDAPIRKDILGDIATMDATLVEVQNQLRRVSSGSIELQEFLPIFNVKNHGALGDASTIDDTAISDTISACDASGGGIVFFPAGTFVHTGISRTENNILFMGLGAGATVLYLADGVDDHSFNLSGNSCGIFDMTVDGNRANQTVAGHGIRLSGEDHKIMRFIVKNTFSYGIAASESSGTMTKRLHIDSGYILNTGLDGIDSKDVADGNEANRVSNVVIRNHGIVDGNAGIDCRGPWQLANISVLDITGSNLGVRFREDDSGTTGWGCDGSSLTNFYILAEAGATGTGVPVPSPFVTVSNGQVDGTTGVSGGFNGVQVGGGNCGISNVEARNGGIGFWATSTALYAEFHACRSVANNDGFRTDAGSRAFISGGVARGNLRYGVNPSDDLRISGLRYSANGSADKNYSSTASAAGAQTIPNHTDSIPITGNNTITSLAAASAWDGRIVTLWRSSGTWKVTDGSNLNLDGDFGVDGDALTLRYDAPNAQWNQVSTVEVRPVCFARDTSTSVTTGGSETKATLDSTSYDNDAIADLGNDRLVITKAGVYIISWAAIFADNSSGSRWAAIWNNGVAERYITQNPVPGNTTEMSMTFHLKLAIGDILEFKYWQDSGSTLTCSGDAQIAWVSDG